MSGLQQHHLHYISFFQHLTADALPDLASLLAPNARFKDPFNDVRGAEAIRKVFEHMFTTTQNPGFIVISAAVDQLAPGDKLMLLWSFSFTSKAGKAFSWQGTSTVRFDESGKALEHIDYWDPAENLYEHIPLLGRLCRIVRRRLSVTA